MRASYFDPAAYPDPIVVVRKDGAVAWVNPAFCQVFGRKPPEWQDERFPLGARRGDPNFTEPRFTSHHMTLTGPVVLDWRRVAGPKETSILIGRDVADLHRKIDELHDQRYDAEAAMNTRMRFLATASHEMRTPLNGVIGVAGLLLRSELTENQRAHAEAIRTSGVALLALVNDVLDLSRLEAGRSDVKHEEFDPCALVQSVVELLSPRAVEKGLELAAVVDPGVPALLMGDEPRIRQILFNLLGNAVKFTETGGATVEASLKRGPKAHAVLTLIVRDTGPGVAPSDHDRIFEEFTQSDTQGEGAGLGLAISRKLARAMGGDITLVSAPGAGATFTLDISVETTAVGERREARPLDEPPQCVVATPSTLQSAALRKQLAMLGVRDPFCAGDRTAAISAAQTAPADAVVLWDIALGEAPTQAIKTASHILLDEEDRQNALAEGLEDYAGYLLKPVRQSSLRDALAGRDGSDDETTGTETVPVDDPEAVATTDGAYILLAEDNEINIVLATAILRQAGHIVDVVKNGVEAVRAAENTAYDMILMDMRMPVMDGLAATRAIREAGDATPIIAMTANALETDRYECIEAGMDDFLAKPFEPADLHAMIVARRRSQIRTPSNEDAREPLSA
ncbi:MAG: response regulator [Pseudomonadota bacterium]